MPKSKFATQGGTKQQETATAVMKLHATVTRWLCAQVQARDFKTQISIFAALTGVQVEVSQGWLHNPVLSNAQVMHPLTVGYF